MSKAKLVLAVTVQGDSEKHYYPVTSFPVSIGRGYHNDIILSDPHIAAAHIRIDKNETSGWRVSDLGSVNPAVVNGAVLHKTSTTISSGDVIRLGSVEIHCFAPDHDIPPPVALYETGSAFSQFTGRWTSWLLLAAAILVVALWSYTVTWSREPALSVIGTATFTIVGILIWATGWSVAGRLMRRQASFSTHIVLASFYIILQAVTWWTGSGISFLASEATWSIWLMQILNAAVFAFLLFGSLALVAHMHRLRRLMTAVFLSFGILIGVLTVDMIAAGRFDPDPPYPWQLKPYLAFMVTTVPADTFVEESRGLFKSKVFKD